jgi:hypothetical protein
MKMSFSRFMVAGFVAVSLVASGAALADVDLSKSKVFRDLEADERADRGCV